jgi:beta-lactamase regulating signal transducer with metallopeptidase domain
MLAWLLTYLVHSTLLVGAVWLISRRLVDRPLALDRLWKLALLGGLVTATVQTAASLSPVAVDVGATETAAAVASAKPTEVRLHITLPDEVKAAEAAPPPAPGSVSASESASGSGTGSETGTGSELGSGSVVPEAGTVSSASSLGADAWIWLLLLVTSISTVLALRLGVSWFRLRRLLADRRPVHSGNASFILMELEARAGLRRPVRLSATNRLDVPIAIGIFRPEICVPERALFKLGNAEMETMLAHELGHLVRRDPAWRLLAGLVCRVFWFQPLNRVIAARLEMASEMLCDDWAVEHTDRPLALARCLTEVAGWIAAPTLGAAVPAMARGGSGLGRRVRRLLAVDDEVGPRRRERWLVPLAAGMVALLVFAAPGATDTAPRVASRPAIPPVPPVPASAPVPPMPPTPPMVAGKPVRGDMRRLLSQLRSGRKQDQNIADWIQLAQALGSPGNASSLSRILQGGIDIDMDIDVEVNPDGSIDIHIRPDGAAADPDAQGDPDPNFFDFDFDFDALVDEHDDDDEDEDEDEDHDCSGHGADINIDIPNIHIPDIHIPDINIDIPHGGLDQDQIREIQRQAKEIARHARQQAKEAARQAREQAQEAREHAHEAAREARRHAQEAREQVQRQMEQAHRQMRDAQRQLRDQQRQLQRQRFSVPPPPRAPRPPQGPRPPAPPIDPFDDDPN